LELGFLLLLDAVLSWQQKGGEFCKSC